MALVINVKNENLLVEMGKLIQEKTAKTVQKMFDLVPLSVVTEKLKLLKIVKIVQKTFPICPITCGNEKIDPGEDCDHGKKNGKD